MIKRRVAVAACGAVCVGALIPATGVLAQSGQRAPLHADLSGANEINPDTGNRGAGDRNGVGSFTGVWRGNRLCYGLTAVNLDQTVAAHIHAGRRNENGPVVQELTHPANGEASAASGCVNVRRAIARAIRRSPARFYINVHTQAFPGGAVRGQLTRGH